MVSGMQHLLNVVQQRMFRTELNSMLSHVSQAVVRPGNTTTAVVMSAKKNTRKEANNTVDDIFQKMKVKAKEKNEICDNCLM